jgi:hypothetical protein
LAFGFWLCVEDESSFGSLLKAQLLFLVGPDILLATDSLLGGVRRTIQCLDAKVAPGELAADTN